MNKLLKISLLGQVDIQYNNQPWSGLVTRKAEALLIYLICTRQPQSREVLAELLWPERPPAQARRNLRTTLSRLRQTLAPYIIGTRQTIAFDYEQPYWFDVAELEKQLSLAQESQALNSHTATVLAQTMSLYQGDFLTGFYLRDAPNFDTWATIERERLHRQTIVGLHQLSDFHSHAATYDIGISWTQHLLTLDEFDEVAHKRLLYLFSLNGQRHAALTHYERYVKTLAQEMGVEPGPDIKQLYEQIQTGLFPQKVESQSDQQVTASPISVSADRSTNLYQILSRLEPLPDQKLFGVAQAQAQVETILHNQAQPWLIAIDGIGGIGKTTLAHTVVQQLAHTERFYDIAWVSAKQEEFRPESGLQKIDKATLDEETLTDSLLHQLHDHPQLTTMSEKRLTLTRLLKQQAYLIIIDNLETVADYQTLLPYLRQMINPSKVLLTSRFSLKAEADVYCLSLSELSQADALALLRYQAQVRGITSLHNASPTQLKEIYQVVGGNPLALKLVIGQILFLPLPQVLVNLQQTQGKPVQDLYTYIYWQAWQMLTPFSRQLMLMLPLCPQSTFDELLELTNLSETDLQSALHQLIALSLLEIGGDLAQPYYRLHRLTETFLFHEVLQWQHNMAQE